MNKRNQAILDKFTELMFHKDNFQEYYDVLDQILSKYEGESYDAILVAMQVYQNYKDFSDGKTSFPAWLLSQLDEPTPEEFSEMVEKSFGKPIDTAQEGEDCQAGLIPSVCIDCVNLTNNGRNEYYCGIKHNVPSDCIMTIPDWQPLPAPPKEGE